MLSQKNFFRFAVFCGIFPLFACSDDSGNKDDTGDIFSGLPNQVYLREIDPDAAWDEDREIISEYKGNAEVKLVLRGPLDYDTDRFLYVDTLLGGKIENGKITVNLPISVESRFLEPFNGNCAGNEEESESCESDVSFPKNLTTTSFGWIMLYAAIPGKENLCPLHLRSGSSDEPQGYNSAGVLYASTSGKIKGIRTLTNSYYKESFVSDYDVNISMGWNMLYSNYKRYNDADEITVYYTLISKDKKILTTGLEWQARCR